MELIVKIGQKFGDDDVVYCWRSEIVKINCTVMSW